MNNIIKDEDKSIKAINEVVVQEGILNETVVHKPNLEETVKEHMSLNG